MKSCARCSRTDVAMVLVKKDNQYLHIQWVCPQHLLELFNRLNRAFPQLDYEAKIRKA